MTPTPNHAVERTATRLEFTPGVSYCASRVIIGRSRSLSLTLFSLDLVKPLFIIALWLLCAGCAVTRENAVAIATRELTRRNLPLPPHYVVTASRITSTPEFAQTVTLWEVTFELPRAKQPVYEVGINAYNRDIDYLLDYRHSVPSGR